ncbi:hypothetical protein niasHS_009422 [Heterodera schachtii]|uniref:B30.2/SPRY domain-containing protein n=1 Tax=Heterodera schachtii TaxID=97005 RepID=A0ABD2JC01_HETSC
MKQNLSVLSLLLFVQIFASNLSDNGTFVNGKNESAAVDAFFQMSHFQVKYDEIEQKITQLQKHNQKLKEAIKLQTAALNLLQPIVDFFRHSGFSLNLFSHDWQKQLQTDFHLNFGQHEEHQQPVLGSNLTQRKPNPPKNRWSLNSDFFLIKPNHLKAVYRAKKNANQNLYAKFVLFPHLAIVYYETKIIKNYRNSSTISIGIWTKSDDTFYKYSNNGFIFGHSATGLGGYPSFAEGDTIGCGANLTSMEIICTKNGQKIDQLNVVQPAPLGPFVPVGVVVPIACAIPEPFASATDRVFKLAVLSD